MRTFECDTSEVSLADISHRPQLCFIDGEHTNSAVCSDFDFCRKVCDDDAVIAFHDTCFVFEGVREIQRRLQQAGTRFAGHKLGGSVYAIFLGSAIENFYEQLLPFAQDEQAYFNRSQRALTRMHLQNRFPILRILDYQGKILRRLRRKVV